MAEGKGVHKVAAAGFNDSDAMERYTRARPSYAVDAVECLMEKVLEGALEGCAERKEPFKILDLACGTGKLTVPVFKFLSSSPSFTKFNFEIYAIDPAEAMRVELDKTMASHTSSNVKTMKSQDGSSHSIPFEDGFFDAVLVGQAFHWFCNEKSMVEMNRVLDKKGGVGMIWNLESQSVEWLFELRIMYQEFDVGLPQYHRMEWKKFLEEREPVGLQCPPLLFQDFRQEITMSPNLLWDRILSKSYIAVLPEEKKAGLKEKVDAHLDKHFPEVGKEDVALPVPCDTKVVWMKKL